MNNYYFIDSRDGRILESGSYAPGNVEEECQEWANTLKCDVWVIRGEHAGIALSPQPEITEREEKEQ